MEYTEFLKQKVKVEKSKGFDIDPKELNSQLFPFQKHIVSKALKNGKYAIFANCGLGKSIMQIEFCHQVNIHNNSKSIIVCPLAVSGQTIQEGIKFGYNIGKFNSGADIEVCNYEQLDNVNIDSYECVVIDESSILKNFEGALKTKILNYFKNYKYKLCCTATPSPNDPMEIGNHSEFLDIMSRKEMLAMYFINDKSDTGKWRLKGHSVNLFYKFIGTWATMISHPKDLGFNDVGYDLPNLNLIERKIITNKRDNGRLFNDSSISATTFNAELKFTKIERLTDVIDIVNNSDEIFIIWVKQNEESEYLKKNIVGSVEVKGSDSAEYKEKTFLDFANSKIRVLITKTKIAQFGLNFQNCHNQIFASLDFSFEGLYQAIRRSYRFNQKHEVNIYLITTDTMENVINNIKIKQKKFEEMQSNIVEQLSSNMDVTTIDNVVTLENTFCKIQNGDCVSLIKNLESESIGLSVFSPPFAELYTFSDKLEDMGNCKDYNDFLIHFKFLVKELFRVMKQGRNVCVHCMDLPIQKGKEGFIGLRDFSGMILKCFEEEGFVYHSRVTIFKDPVLEMIRTKALGLLYKQIKKDSTMNRVGIPDYVLIFRKDGDRTDPVTNTSLPVELWEKYASPVWMDINYSNTLQGIRDARDTNDEKHISPLQLDTIERLIHLYSNKGDTVFTPFMGIGSEVYQAIKMDRYGIGFELKDSYFSIAKKNIQDVIESKNQLSLF
jgi:hypothetical protein